MIRKIFSLRVWEIIAMVLLIGFVISLSFCTHINILCIIFTFLILADLMFIGYIFYNRSLAIPEKYKQLAQELNEQWECLGITCRYNDDAEKKCFLSTAKFLVFEMATNDKKVSKAV